MISEKVYLDRIGFVYNTKYTLDLKWQKIAYDKGVCTLKGAYFSGPVLQDLEQMFPNDSMLLDFYKQYYMYSTNVYIVNLSWGVVNMDISNNKIRLFDTKLIHITELNKVPKLRNTDFIRINTKGHDVETHAHHPTYESTALNSLGEPFNFWKTDGSFRKVTT